MLQESHMYFQWNRRCFPSFKEEIIDGLEYPANKPLFAIKDAVLSTVDSTVKDKLVAYLRGCQGLMAGGSFVKIHPFTKEKTFGGVSYYTDGEMFFERSLIDYVDNYNLGLPSKWYEVIKKNNFVINAPPEDLYEIDFDHFCAQTFDQPPVYVMRERPEPGIEFC